MSSEKFLIDSNSLIEPYNRYYPFDITEKFWEQLKKHIESGSIVLLDMVKNEINQCDDDLSVWLNGVNIKEEIDHRDPIIIKNYSKILQYIQNESAYKGSALRNWAQEHVADAWLIASAMNNDYKIITFEKPQFRRGNIYKNAKIPDVADIFNVKTNDLFYLMRVLKIKL